MRPRTTRYGLNPRQPVGLHALRRQLEGRGEGAPPETLGPITALVELQRICQTMLAGRGGPNPSNRPSLTKDISNALKALGPKTRAALGATLTSFQKDIAM